MEQELHKLAGGILVEQKLEVLRGVALMVQLKVGALMEGESLE
jgi:hypothetical protein